MNKNILKKVLIVIFWCITVACDKDEEPSTTGPSNAGPGAYTVYVEELNNLIKPLIGANPVLGYDDLQPLSYLGGSRIVGLGEATHGTREFFQLKHRIFKYLVENYNFKIFGFECDLGESIFFDRFVCSGEGNIERLMSNKMHFWTWRTREVRDLLEWMKTYNEGKSEEEKIHYIGFDCQFLTYQPDLLLEYFSDIKPEFIVEINPTLDMIKTMNNSSPSSVREYYTNMNENEKQEISDSLGNILTKLNNIESELISKSSHFEYQCMRQLVRNMQQVNDVLFGNTHNEAIKYREKYMAENALWLSTLFGENTQIAIWAHNFHVANDVNYGDSGTMGHMLKDEMEDQYQIVGFSFSKGSFTAVTQSASGVFTGIYQHTINSNPREGSLNYVFYHAQYDNFILKVADIPINSDLGNWISTARPLLTIGSTYIGDPKYYYRDVLLRDYFDVVINYDITAAAIQLNNMLPKSKAFSPDI